MRNGRGPVIGVVAKTRPMARQIILDLGFSDAVDFATDPYAGRGYSLDALLIHESAEMTGDHWQSLLPCLLGSKVGRVYRLSEYSAE
jgi:hypothetical protein